jgi:hypothetical protein
MEFALVTDDDRAIVPGHPDYDFWHETYQMEDLIAGWHEATGQVPEWAGLDDPTANRPRPLPSRPKPPAPPSIALLATREEAAGLLRMSVDSLERHVLPNIRVVQVGRRQLVPIRELEAWIESKSARALRG